MKRPEICPQCGSDNATAYYIDGTVYDPMIAGMPLWDQFKCDVCGCSWAFTFIELPKEEAA